MEGGDGASGKVEEVVLVVEEEESGVCGCVCGRLRQKGARRVVV
jgi:hypothetical protein